MKVRKRSKIFYKYALAGQRGGGFGKYKGKIPRRRIRGAGFGKVLGKLGLSVGKRLLSIGKDIAKGALPDLKKAAVEAFTDVRTGKKSIKSAIKDTAKKGKRQLASSARNTLQNELKKYGIK